MTLSKLRPLLRKDEWGFDLRHDSLTPELEAVHSLKYPAANIINRLMRDFSSFIEPLRELTPKSWQILREHTEGAYIIEAFCGRAPEFEPHSLHVIIPVPAGFATLSVYQGALRTFHDAEEQKSDFFRRLQRTPPFFKKLLNEFAKIGINDTNEYYQAANTIGLAEVPYNSSSVSTFASGALKRQLSKKLGDISEMRLLAYRAVDIDMGATEGWYLFFNNDKTGDGETVWVALDPKFKDVRKLVQIEEAYDLMLEHYLLGKPGEFDFRPFTEAIT